MEGLALVADTPANGPNQEERRRLGANVSGACERDDGEGSVIGTDTPMVVLCRTLSGSPDREPTNQFEVRISPRIDAAVPALSFR
jgi:hypothetical protein